MRRNLRYGTLLPAKNTLYWTLLSYMPSTTMNSIEMNTRVMNKCIQCSVHNTEGILK